MQKQKSFLDLGLLGLDLKNLILVGAFQVEWKDELGQMKVVWEPDWKTSARCPQAGRQVSYPCEVK